jgi:penicillin-binding protein 1A
MGYTPQILAGVWVGCDDRYIRFSDNYFGQGAHGALPIWAYFMSKVADDPSCNLDKNANFEKPSNLTSDFNVPFVGKDSVAIDMNIEKTEDIGAESDYKLPENTASETHSNNKTENKKPNTPNIPTTKANKEAVKPKAVMPIKKNKA